MNDELRLCALFALRRGGDADPRLFAVLADDARGELLLGTAAVEGPTFPALTQRSPQAHLFEREIHEQYGLRPEGHPWLKPVRFERPLHADPRTTPPPAIGAAEFYKIAGEAIHEVAVGPVHAGVIEPGHFRFQCHGEHVFHLEISLGYQHRGVEAALREGPGRTSLHLIETLAGDTSVGHALAFGMNLEALAGLRVGGHAHVVRAIALELERLANHTGDLGALAATSVPADGGVLRAHPRRLPEPVGAVVRQSLRPQPRAPRRRAVLHRRGDAGQMRRSCRPRGRDVTTRSSCCG
jgi:hypothetical protein